jgi:hypothetical protein
MDVQTGYLGPAEVKARIEWQGSVLAALEDGLQHRDIDPGAAELRQAWADLQEVYQADLQPAVGTVETILADVVAVDPDQRTEFGR